MFRGAGKKKTDEQNADDMASRLQLDIGKLIYRIFFCLLVLIYPLDGDKSTGSSRSQNLVDIFRGVSFNDWLQLIMQVSEVFKTKLG